MADDDEIPPVWPRDVEHALALLETHRLAGIPARVGLSVALMEDLCRRVIALEEANRG